MSVTAREALDRGYDAGNYAHAYQSNDLDTSFEVAEDFELNDPYREPFPREFRAGFVLGFFSSYEVEELDGEDLEAFQDAVSAFPDFAKEVGAVGG